jgi:hypothetical protein
MHFITASRISGQMSAKEAAARALVEQLVRRVLVVLPALFIKPASRCAW